MRLHKKYSQKTTRADDSVRRHCTHNTELGHHNKKLDEGGSDRNGHNSVVQLKAILLETSNESFSSAQIQRFSILDGQDHVHYSIQEQIQGNDAMRSQQENIIFR